MLGALPLLLLGSGFCSGCETALFSLSAHQRHRLARSTQLADRSIVLLLRETRHLLITLLMLNMTINVLYFVVSTVLFMRLQDARGFGGATMAALSTAALLGVILFGEILPKLVAARLSQGWARTAALPLLILHRAITPIRKVLNWVVITPLARLVAPPQRPAELSAEELEALLEMSQRQGVINPDEEAMLQQVLLLSQLKVRHLMTPRVDIAAHNLADPPAALIKLIREKRYSHIPVYREDLDHIEGVVHAREVLLRQPVEPGDLDRLVRQVRFVPELQRADSLLIQFRKSGTTMAIAVDEFGGTEGLVTLEDVVEHMVGDIASPHDEPDPRPPVEALGPGRWRVSAALAIDTWSDTMAQQQPLYGLHTMGGLVMARLGRLPQAGDTTTVGNVEIEVESMVGARVESLLLRLLPGPAPQPPNAATRQGGRDARDGGRGRRSSL